MSKILLGNLKGPKGDKGDKGDSVKGDPGPAGPNTIPAADFIGSEIARPGSPAEAALLPKIVDVAGGLVSAVADEAYAPSTGRPTRPQEKVVTTFASGHGWTSSGAWSSVNLNDTGDIGWANQVVSGVTDGAGGQAFFLSPALATPIDPTGKTIVALMKVSDPSKLSSLLLHIGTTTTFTNSNSYSVASITTGRFPFTSDDWALVTFSLVAVVGTGAGTAATRFRWRVTDDATGPITVKFGGTSLYQKPGTFPNGCVVFTFDDSSRSLWDLARPIFNKYRYLGTVFPVTNRIDTPTYLTMDHLRALDRDGWEIGAHATSMETHNQTLPGMTPQQKADELRALRLWGVQNGFRSESFAYGGGHFDTDSYQTVSRYFKAGRTTTGQFETVPPARLTTLRSLAVTNANTLATIKGKVDSAYASGSVLILTFHEIVTVAAAYQYTWTAADLEALVDYIAGLGMPVLSLADALAAMR
ncbi:polysaccharide deacetylase family protein [Microbacterium sp. cx-59]|uniref:polysaccharide deacetylase family protein n=1 Tax=Microbacterium sp. cx-59 TaxID=2891207 RepID=UPI001E41D32A|nr:polysaccharide deacetylase family protein [Microbacterium sp. cx-59]MCC4906987.1 polysaccharide deacetylase family protein [Microbacterium sp. cx-59]